MLNLVVAVVLFFVLIFSTFFVLKLPYITFFINELPPETIINYSDNYLSYGFIQTNIQLPIILACALILRPRTFFTFMSIYLFLGFYGFPIFYLGGGLDYLKEPSIGYFLSAILISLISSNIIWKNEKKNKFIYNTRFTVFISLIALMLIHISGILTSYILMKHTVGLLTLAKSYFFIPIFSQILMTILVCIFSTKINMLRSFLFRQDADLSKKIIEGTKRRRMQPKKIPKKGTKRNLNDTTNT